MSLITTSVNSATPYRNLEHWLQKIKSGEEGYGSITQQEDEIRQELGEDFALLLEACADKPGF